MSAGKLNIRIFDLGWLHSACAQETDAAIGRVIDRANFILGEEVEQFERAFAADCGAVHAIGVGNGQDAIKLALLACGIGPGCEVIVPANTCTPTWLGVAGAGAVPVPVDADPRTMNMDPLAIEAAISERTKAILPVHLYGRPADLRAIGLLARRHELKLIHDCAQAHGASIEGQPLGAFGDAAAWSYYPTKNLGALGDGGAVTTDDPVLAERVRDLRRGTGVAEPGSSPGVNSRLDELQAAILRARLPHLAAWNARRADHADIYFEELAQTGLVLPAADGAHRSAWHMFVIRHPERDRLKRHLEKNGIETLIRYRDLPYRAAGFAQLDLDPAHFPVSEAIRNEVLSLPVGPHLTPDQVRNTCRLITAFL